MNENNYLSKDYTNCLRGIFAILVVIHHLYQYSGLLSGTLVGGLLQLLGSLSVAMFFFFSGYGLMYSSGKENYTANFIKNRFIPLYDFYAVLVALYAVWTYFIEGTFSPEKIVQSFLFGGTVVTNGWYMQATFMLYILFFLVFNYIKTPKNRLIVFGVCIVIYCAYCYCRGLSYWWYSTAPCMFVGMLWCYFKDSIDKLLEKYSYLVFALFSIMFIIFVVLSKLGILNTICDMMYPAFFVGSAISLSYILANTPVINNPFFTLCGRYSLEIYLTHGFFLRLIKANIITDVFLFIVVVIVGTILASIVMKMLYTKICEWLTKKGEPKSTV